MQINKPPSAGTPTTGGSINSTAADKANRTQNLLAKLVGQVVGAQVVQSKAIQVTAAQANAQDAAVTARLLLDQGADKKNLGNSTSSVSPTTSTSAPSASNTAQPSTTSPGQTQYQTTLQIGNDRVIVMTDQPLAAGTQLTLKVNSPQLIQMLDQPATMPPVTSSSADTIDNLLNTVLRQALPLQQPIANLLGNIASSLLLPDPIQSSAPLVSTSATSNALATTTLNLPSNLSPAIVKALQPLLTQLVNSQLTLDNVTDPGALRSALANSGLFREANLVQWAQALLKQFPDLPTRGAQAPGAGITTPMAAALVPSATAAIPIPTAATTDPLTTALQTVAATSALSQSVASQIAIAAATQNRLSTQDTANHAAVPTVAASDSLDAKQIEIVRNATASAGASSHTTLHDAVDADSTDVDALRKQLLQALGERAQKNQPAFAGAATKANPTVGPASAATTAQIAKAAAGISATNASNPTSAAAKMATTALPIAIGVTADTKTALEQLVSVTSQRLLGGRSTAGSPVSEDQVLAILRQLPMAHAADPHATTRAKPQDDEQWLLQLLRSSFGALKHLQLQQATNINAAAGAQPASHDSPIAPLQIELPMLVAQQWQNIHIEIDRRTPENSPDASKKERSWRVTLRFELPQQGIIVAQLNLAGVQVSATLWAEKQATCQQLQQQLKELSDRLGKAGAHVTTLDVRHGQPPAAKTRIEQRLIDIRT